MIADLLATPNLMRQAVFCLVFDKLSTKVTKHICMAESVRKHSLNHKSLM